MNFSLRKLMQTDQPLDARTRFNMKSRTTLGPALMMLVGSTVVAFAQDDNWKEGFAGCTGTSPYIEALISKTDPDVRPLMRIGAMQAWAIKDETGKPATALTTEDGLTIVGRIIGPQGEDISAALLATVPNPAAKALVTSTTNVPQTPVAPQLSTRGAMMPMPGSVVTTSTTSPALNQLKEVLSSPEGAQAPAPIPRATVDPERNALASAPITPIDQPLPDVQAGIDTIFKQAGDERIWFSAGTPKAGAPVVYMLADPECPHCQWTIDQMHGQIASGDIDLRIIFAPITGVGGFETSLSILHSENIPQTFMAHMTSKTRGTAAVAKMDTDQADKAVIQGVVDNINWMRANKMPGVPFFLYQTDQGAKFAFSELPTDILTVAKAEAAPQLGSQ